MHLKQALLFLLSFAFISIASAQKVTNDIILRLEPHPRDNLKFVAKFFSKETFKLIEYWEMGTKVENINANNFNKLKKERLIYPDGQCVFFYPNSRRKIEAFYENGFVKGDIKGIYPNGVTEYVIHMNGTKKEKATFYYPNGEIKRKEEYLGNRLNGKVTGYYMSGEKNYVAEYINNKLNGKYLSLHENGQDKRKSKFEDNEEITSKCYDVIGNEVDCEQYMSPLNYKDNLETFKKEIEKLDLNFNKANVDTAEFRIVLEINTIGKANLAFYHFKHADSLEMRLKHWVEQLQPFTAAYVDGIPSSSYFNISFPVSSNKVLWLEECQTFYSLTSLPDYEEQKPTWFWESPNPGGNEVYFIVDNLPSFPGGEKALKSFIANHLQYPRQAQQQAIQGKVFVTFIVEKDGKVTYPRIVKSVHPLLDNEALRVVKLLPDWQPGTHHGRPARVSYTVPINFVLTKNRNLNTSNRDHRTIRF